MKKVTFTTYAQQSRESRARLDAAGGKNLSLRLQPRAHRKIRLLMQRYGDTKMSATIHRLIERARV